MKFSIVAVFVFSIGCLSSFAQKLTVQSPSDKITVALYSTQDTDLGGWSIKASYNNNGKISEVVPRIDLGLSRSDHDFSKELKFLKAGKLILIEQRYSELHGKKSVCTSQLMK